MGNRLPVKRYYLDNCATTPLAPEVSEAMAAYMSKRYGNPSSIHHEGRQAARVLSDCRRTIAESIGAKPAEIVFTGSGTESNNLAIGGIVSRAIRTHGRAKVITSTTEHASVRTRLSWEKRMHGEALQVVEVPVGSDGMLDIAQLDASLDDETTLVTVLLANNETGIMQDMEALKQRKLAFPKVPWLLDVVQAYTKIMMDVRLWPFDLLSFAAHKIYGPKGVGALFVRGGIELDPFIFGGSQEKFRRAGTENMPGIVGFATAVDLAQPAGVAFGHMATLEREFLSALRGHGAAFQINGPDEYGEQRLPGFLNLSFDGVAGREDLQIALDLEGVGLSSTSACHSGVSEESHVLTAMGINGDRRSGAIRLLFGRYHALNDAHDCARIIAMTVARIQAAGLVA